MSQQVDVAKMIMSLTDQEVDILLEDLLVDVVRQLTSERWFKPGDFGVLTTYSY